MTVMAKARGTSKTGPGLSLVGSGQRSGDDAELVELREELAAAGVPEDAVSRAMRGADTPQEVVHRLIEAGVLSSPQESLAEMLAEWKPLLKRGCGSFDAELAGLEFLGMMREAAPDADQMPDMLTGLIGQAEQHGGPEALVMLRVLAVVGPPTVRPVAAQAADRLAEAGLTDPRWVAELGMPVVGDCFGYGDTLGGQESVIVTFSYGRKRHAVSVLIDHFLGGGVKDCWPSDAPERVRAECRRMAKRDPLIMQYREYTPAAARAILDKALAAKPCPVQADQVEDVGDYLDLVRARVALMPDDSAVPVAGVTGTRARRTGGVSVGGGGRSVHRVKITMRGAARRSGVGWKCPRRSPCSSCTTLFSRRSAGRATTCGYLPPTTASSACPTGNWGTAVPRPRNWTRSHHGPPTASVIPTTSVTTGNMTSPSRMCCRPSPAWPIHVVWPGGGPARRRIAAGCGGMRN
jgi:hypothetical protein